MEDLYSDYLKKLAASQSPKDKLSPTWDEMKRRLDREMPEKNDRRRFIILWSSIALIIGLSAFIFLPVTHNTPFIQTENNTASILLYNKAENASQPPALAQNLHSNSADNIQNSAPATVLPETNSIKNNAIKKAGESGINAVYQTTQRLKGTNHTPAISNINNPVKPDHKNGLTNDKQLAEQNGLPEMQNQNSAALHSNKNENPVEVSPPTIHQPFTNTAQHNHNDTLVNKAIQNTVSIKQPTSASLKSAYSRWEIVPTVSADFLNANLKPGAYPGFLAGANVHYNLNSHWALKSGVLFNHIRINSNGESFYHLPSKEDFNLNYSKVEDIKGYINAIEVPLAIRYTLNPHSRFSFHFSAGLSTVFYQKTDCTYKLLVSNNYHYWNLNDDTDDEYARTEWLGNLRVATGFSYLLNKGVRIEFEPSYKLPLEELSEGHQKIGALSLNVSLRIPVSKK